MMKSKQDTVDDYATTTEDGGQMAGRAAEAWRRRRTAGCGVMMKKTGGSIGHVPVGKDVRDAQERARPPWTGVNTLGIGGQP